MRLRPVLMALAVTGVLAGCGSSGGGSTPSSPSSPSSASPSTSSTAAATGQQYYLSIGDSYGAGYQPTGRGQGVTTRNGFAYQVVDLAKAKGYDLTLANVACSGATSMSLLQTAGCQQSLLGPGATAYSTTQAAAAEAFLRAHRGHVALVTVSIGGNDITRCGTVADPVTCVQSALTAVEKNVATLLTGLRAAGGSSLRIVGTTYPDVLLGNYLSTDATTRGTAQLSVVAFQSLINPGLKQTYAAAGASFVDVTAATGAYGSLSTTTTLKPYGTIPVPVAKICTLTYYCQYQDIHPRTDGYAIIAKLVAAQLPAR